MLLFMFCYVVVDDAIDVVVAAKVTHSLSVVALNAEK